MVHQLPLHIHIFVDDHRLPKHHQQKMINHYIIKNRQDINTLCIFVKSQSAKSVKAWNYHFRYHPFRRNIHIVRDLLVMDDGYISSIYKFRNLPTGRGGVKFKFTCIFDYQEFEEKYDDFVFNYSQVKKKLPKCKINISLPKTDKNGIYQCLGTNYLTKYQQKYDSKIKFDDQNSLN